MGKHLFKQLSVQSKDLSFRKCYMDDLSFLNGVIATHSIYIQTWLTSQRLEDVVTGAEKGDLWMFMCSNEAVGMARMTYIDSQKVYSNLLIFEGHTRQGYGLHFLRELVNYYTLKGCVYQAEVVDHNKASLGLHRAFQYSLPEGVNCSESAYLHPAGDSGITFSFFRYTVRDL